MSARRLVPWGSTASRWELRGLVVVGVLLLLAYLVAALLFARSTGNRGLTIDADAPPGGVVLGLEVVSIDTQTASARGRMHLDVSPELTDDAGQLTESITVIAILAGKSEWVFPKGQRPGVVDVQLYLDGAVEDYPLDRWVTLFGGLAFPSSTDEDGVAGEPLPTAVAVESSLPGWVTREMTLDEFFDTVPGTSVEGPISTVGLRFSRAGSTLAIVFLVLALMVVLAVLGMVVAVAVARGRRRIEPTLTGFLAALLFALIPLRTVLPGAPPLGAWIDMLVFFWVEILLMTALALYVATWLSKGPRPDRPAAGADAADPVAVPDDGTASPAEVSADAVSADADGGGP